MRTSVFWLLTLVCLSGSSGQTHRYLPPPQKSVGFKIGTEISYLKDLNFSPLNYLGVGLVGEVEYHHENVARDIYFGRLSFSLSTLQTKASTGFTSVKYGFNPEIGFLKNLKKPSSRFNYHLGGRYHTYLEFVDYGHTSSVTFFTLHSLDLVGRFSWRIRRRQLFHTELGLPVFGLLVRPPYTGWDKFIVDNQDSPIKVFFRGRWTSLNNFFGINWTVGYLYEVNRNWDFTLQYRFRAYQTDVLDPAKIFTSQVSIGANVKL